VDALALLAETALHNGLDPGGPGERYQVVVHVDAPALADPDQPGQSVLEGGTRVPAETSRRLACDASRVVMRHDADGRIVASNRRRTRSPPPASPANVYGPTGSTWATPPWRPSTEPGRNSRGEIIRRRCRAHVGGRATVATPEPGGRVT